MVTADVPVQRPEDLTAQWLTATVGAGEVGAFTAERIGTGQMSECYRVALDYARGDGPDSVVLKVAAAEPTSRQSGLALGLYEREVRFYADLAPAVYGTSDAPVAGCFHASFQPQTGAFTLLLDDAAPAVAGDEIRGAPVGDAVLALEELGRLHAPLIGRDPVGPAQWLVRDAPLAQEMVAGLFAAFLDRYGQQVTAEQREVGRRFVAAFDAYAAEESAPGRVQGLVHGDYRLDNMLFGRPGSLRDLTVVDWQTVTLGPAMTDVAYFLGCALPSGDRRAHYDTLLSAYHRGLGPDSPVGIDEVREGVRRQSFFGVMMVIVSSMLAAQTQRGDTMFMTMLERHAGHVVDTGALEVLPS
jgi:hypothetical protein